MVHIIILGLMICGKGLLTAKASQTTNVSARPGDNVTICCQHTAEIANYIRWFKQTGSAVPLSFVYKLLPYDTEVEAKYSDGFNPDHIVMSLNSKNSSLRFLNVDISDSGLYYCGWHNRGITFGDGTHLDIKERSDTPLNLTYKITNEDLKRNISTRYCPGNIFYILTFIFGGIVVILIIFPLTLFIVKNRKTQKKDADQHETQHHEEPHSTVYAALHFSKKKTRRANRHAEDADVVYSATR